MNMNSTFFYCQESLQRYGQFITASLISIRRLKLQHICNYKVSPYDRRCCLSSKCIKFSLGVVKTSIFFVETWNIFVIELTYYLSGQISHNPDLDRKWGHYNQNNLPVGRDDNIQAVRKTVVLGSFSGLKRLI